MTQPNFPETAPVLAEASPHAPLAPLVYEPSFEQPEEDEAETTREMVETLRKISETVHKDEGHAYRSVHAKSHGLLRGEIEVLQGLPAVLAQGAFAHPGIRPVVMRLSSTPGDLLDDKVSTPRGLALKIIGVEGVRLPGSEGDTTQDFVMINGPAFSTPTAKKFLGSLKLLAGTTDKAPGAKNVLSAALRGLESLIEKAGGESAMLKSLGGHPATNPLGETYYTQVPMLYGPYMAKLSLAPVSAELTALKDAPVDLSNPDALREAVARHFQTRGGTWELRVQLCVDLETMPIEDAPVVWPEDTSPYVTVARISVSPQPAWSEDRVRAVNDGMAFSPWHGLAAHRPIGSIMRVRKAAYEMAARFRSEHNPVKVSEPRELGNL
ncbi:catalase [Rhodoferax koreense]|uniref:Catalase n=1 Tax=Rhodoferax koreensis TaxID=1842727 RepID=A0A1P8JYQ5_9BURK|nr:catalase family protein [Rhodoferax koreense]APW38889.1 catalase [Rhodoferax koreense]